MKKTFLNKKVFPLDLKLYFYSNIEEATNNI